MLHQSQRSEPAIPETYVIGQLAEEFGLTLRSIRFYEDAGLLQPTRAGQCRHYSHRDRARLALICRGKRLGFSIAEIKEFIDLYNVDPGQSEQMHYLLECVRQRAAALKRQLADVTQTLTELKTIESEIQQHLKSSRS